MKDPLYFNSSAPNPDKRLMLSMLCSCIHNTINNCYNLIIQWKLNLERYKIGLPDTTCMYMVIFAVVLFSRISRVRPRKNFHFSLCLFTVMKTSEKS